MDISSLFQIEWTGIGALVLSSLALMGSPGPATLSLAAVGAAYGRRAGSAYYAGIVTGTWVVLFATATGLTAALLALPGLRPVLIAAAAAYIVYLAWRIATAPAISKNRPGSPAPSWAGGFFLAIANPKAYAAIGAVFAGIRLLPGQAVADGVAKFAILAGMVVMINAAWLVSGAAMSGLMTDPRRSRAINIAFALALLAATIAAIVL